MSCSAITAKQEQCHYAGKHTFGMYRSCGIKSHILQIQKKAGLLGSDVSPSKLNNPDVDRKNTRKPRAKPRKVKEKFIQGNHGIYTIVRKIGKGAYGEVYDTKLDDKMYAVKQQQAKGHGIGTGISTTVLVEADILTRFRHPNLIELKEVFFERGKTHINYVLTKEDCSLRTIPPQSPAIVISLVSQLLNVVNFLHQQHIIHADIKQENILLTKKGDSYQLRLADFGLAQYDQDQTKSIFVQTFWYRAPEIFTKIDNYGKPIDIWSIGIVLRELLVGKPLSDSKIENTYFETIKSLLGVPANISAEIHRSATPSRLAQWEPTMLQEYIKIVERCLVYEPSGRATISELLQSPLFSNFTLLDGTHISHSEPMDFEPTTFELIHPAIQDYFMRHQAFHHFSTLIVAAYLFNRYQTIEELLPFQKLKYSFIAFNLASKLNQHIVLSLTTQQKILGHDYSNDEIWESDMNMVHYLGFKLYPDQDSFEKISAILLSHNPKFQCKN